MIKSTKKSLKPQSPSNLGPAGEAYFALVAEAFELLPEDVPLLVAACEMLDRAASAKAIIAKEGVTTTDRWGQVKPHPAVDIERQSRLAFVRIRRELGLDAAVPPDSRPPLPRGYR